MLMSLTISGFLKHPSSDLHTNTTKKTNGVGGGERKKVVWSHHELSPEQLSLRNCSQKPSNTTQQIKLAQIDYIDHITQNKKTLPKSSTTTSIYNKSPINNT